MGQEFFIKNDTLEEKVRQILPSQGGLGQNFDLSASTQIVPIVDLTESAEGSTLRGDLQTALSLGTITQFSVSNTSTTLISNTGYYRVFGQYARTGGDVGEFRLTDGVTTKPIIQFVFVPTSSATTINLYDFNVFLEAGESLVGVTSGANGILNGCTRQLAAIDGTLTNP